jgi:hypothetical protein
MVLLNKELSSNALIPDRFQDLHKEELVMTTDMVECGQDSSGVTTLNRGAAEVSRRSSIARSTMIKDDIYLPLNNAPGSAEIVPRNKLESISHHMPIGDLTIYVLLISFIAVLALALVTVRHNDHMLDDPISFDRGE